MVDFEEDLKNCVRVMQQGGTILYPTDTVWGLGCDALNAGAVSRILDIKQRPKEKSMIVLLAEAKDVIRYVATPHPDVIDIVEHFEKPTTVVYENGLHFPANLLAADGSIGIRVPDDLFCRALVRRLRRPIVSTSANLSGRPAPAMFNQVDPDIIAAVDYVVRYRQADTTFRPPSRIVRICDDGRLEILRA